MNRKDLDLIAGSIRRSNVDDEAKTKLAQTLADDLALAVRNFDRDKFYAACGVTVKKPFNPFTFILKVEDGEITDEEELAEGMQQLIDRGMIVHLSHHWQRAAHSFIQQGLCVKMRRG